MLDDLIAGLRRFQSDTYPGYRRRYRRLIDDGQHPSTLFIGCADSRVVPDMLLDTRPGELFIERNVGAFVPPYELDAPYHGTAAAIEYAVLALEVTDIVVCGHSHCGAIEALYEPPSESTPHITQWLELGRPARDGDWRRPGASSGGSPGTPASGRAGVPDEATLRATEQRSVALQLSRLASYPFVAERIHEGVLWIHGWHYVIEDGCVLTLDVEREAFVPLASTDPPEKPGD